MEDDRVLDLNSGSTAVAEHRESVLNENLTGTSSDAVEGAVKDDRDPAGCGLMQEVDRGSREREDCDLKSETDGRSTEADGLDHAILGGCEAGFEADGDSKFGIFDQGAEVHGQEDMDGDLSAEHKIIADCTVGDGPECGAESEFYVQSTGDHVQEHRDNSGCGSTDGRGRDLKLEMGGRNIENEVQENKSHGVCRMGDQPDGDPKTEELDQSTEVHVHEHGDGNRSVAIIGQGGDLKTDVSEHNTKHDVQETGGCGDELSGDLKLESNDRSPKDVIKDSEGGGGCDLGGEIGPKMDESALENTESVAFEAQDSGVYAGFVETNKALEVNLTVVSNDQSRKSILTQMELVKESGSSGEINMAATEGGAGSCVGAVSVGTLEIDTREASTSLEIHDGKETMLKRVSCSEKRQSPVDIVIGCDVTDQYVGTTVSVMNVAEDGTGEAPATSTPSMSGPDQAMECEPMEALSTIESAEQVAPFGVQDAGRRAEVEINNNRTEIMVVGESTSYQSHRTNVSSSYLSGHVRNADYLIGVREPEEPDPPSESEEMNRNTEAEMLSMSNFDKEKVSEFSILDSSLIDKNQDVREVNNTIPSREVQELEMAPSDGTMNITNSNDLNLSNLVLKVPKSHQTLAKTSVFDISLVEKNPDAEGVDTVLASKEVHNIDSVLSTDTILISKEKVLDLANLEVEAQNPKCATSGNIRDVQDLESAQAVMNNAPLVEAHSGYAYLVDDPMGRDLASIDIGSNSNIMETVGSDAHAADMGIALRGEGVNPEMLHCEEDTKGTSTNGDADIILNASSDFNQKEVITEVTQAGEKKLLDDVDGLTVKDIGFSVTEDGQHASYGIVQKEKASLSVSDLVWGKVKSHPWWPGQIFDSSDASELALKYQKKDNFLVAYFGDKTFAWCDESQLKPFDEYFSQMVKQCSTDIFIDAVDDALEEVFRRVQLGMTCHCIPEDFFSEIKNQKVENAGIQKRILSQAFDRFQIVNSFQPKRFLDYIRALAQYSTAKDDMLELLIIQAQLNAFYWSKGYSQQPVLFFGGGMIENDAMPSMGKRSGDNAVGHSSPTLLDLTSDSNQRDRKSSSSKQEHALKDSDQKTYELKEEETTSQLVNGDKNEAGLEFASTSCSHLSGMQQKIADFYSSVSQGLTSSRGLKDKSTLIGSFKIGECIRRAASQLTSSTAVKCTGEALRKSVTNADHTMFDVSGFDDFPHMPLEASTTDMYASEDYSPSEMFSQLCFSATDPLKQVEKVGSKRGRIHACDSSDEMLQVEKVGGKRGRKKKSDSQPTSVPAASSEKSPADYMSDSYWSEMLFHSSPENKPSTSGMKRRGGSHVTSKRKKRKSLGEPASLVPLAPILDTPKLQAETPIPNLKALPAERPLKKKNADESTPTELILCFNKPDSLPSEADLIKIFGRYGPLKETETEVMRKANRVKVVFKRRADAEIAFSSAGKYSIFGPALISYRLRYLSSPKAPPSTTKQDSESVSLDTTVQHAKDALAESTTQNATHVPDTTPQCTVALPEIKPEARNEPTMDGGNLEDSSTTMKDPKDTTLVDNTLQDAKTVYSDTTTQYAEDVLTESTMQEATHVPDTTPQYTVVLPEIKPKEAKDVAIMNGGKLKDSGRVQYPEDAPPVDTTLQDAEDALSKTPAQVATCDPDSTAQDTEVAVSEIKPQEAKGEATMDSGNLEDLGATIQDPKDAPSDTTLLDMEDACAEIMAQDVTHVPDITPQDTKIAVLEIKLQEAEDEATVDGGNLKDSNTTMQDPGDAFTEITAQDAADVPDITPQDPKIEVLEIKPQEVKDEVTVDGSNLNDSDTTMQDPEDEPPMTMLQEVGDAIAETTAQDATNVPDTTPEEAKLSEIKPQEAKHEGTMDGCNLEYLDAKVAPEGTTEQDLKDAVAESMAQDAMHFPDAKVELSEIKPPEAKDETTMDAGELENSGTSVQDARVAPLDMTELDMINAVSESAAEDATHFPDTVQENADVAFEEFKPQEAKDEEIVDGGNLGDSDYQVGKI